MKVKKISPEVQEGKQDYSIVNPIRAAHVEAGNIRLACETSMGS